MIASLLFNLTLLQKEYVDVLLVVGQILALKESSGTMPRWKVRQLTVRAEKQGVWKCWLYSLAVPLASPISISAFIPLVPSWSTSLFLIPGHPMYLRCLLIRAQVGALPKVFACVALATRQVLMGL